DAPGLEDLAPGTRAGAPPPRSRESTTAASAPRQGCVGSLGYPRRLCRQSVLVVQPAEHRNSDHAVRCAVPPGPGDRVGRDRRALCETLVRPGTVEVADVLGQDPPEVPLAEDQEVVDALPADAAEEALADRVGPRRPDRRPDHLDPAPCGEAAERGSVL